jgi:hypothetical protein
MVWLEIITSQNTEQAFPFFRGWSGGLKTYPAVEFSAVKPTCPISPTPCLRATPFPADFRRQYTHHGTGINPKSMHT